MLTFPPELEDEFAELQFALDNTERGGWFFLVYKQGVVRDELMARIKAECELPIFQWQYSNETPSYPIDYLNSLSESQKQNRAIVFFINVTTGGDKVIKSLDFNREKFSEYPHCLVFFLTELELKDVAITAGHFWAQRRGRFDFSSFFVAAEDANKPAYNTSDWYKPLLNFDNYQEAEKALAFYQCDIDLNAKATLSLAETYDKIAYALYYLGRYAEALPYAQQVLALRQQLLGDKALDVAGSLSNLALLYLYKGQGKYAEAEPLYLRSLAIREQVLDKDHPDVAISLNHLAGLYKAQGKYAEAEPLYLRSLAIREQVLGKDHPHVATSLNHLAALYYAQGKYAEAEPLYLRGLAIREQVLGKEHRYVAGSLNNLAGLYQAQGKYAEAEPLYLRSLAIREHVLGKKHPYTQIAQKNYNDLLKKLNNS